MHLVAVSFAGLYGGIGQDDRPGDFPSVQVLGGYFLPVVYCALPVYVPLLCVGVEERADVSGDNPCSRSFVYGKHLGGVSLFEDLRRAGKAVAEREVGLKIRQKEIQIINISFCSACSF